MKELTEILELKRRQLSQLQEEVESLERAMAIIGRKAAPQAAPRTGRGSDRARKSAPERPKAPRKKGVMSIPDAAERVLKEAAQPLHAKQIAERAGGVGVETTAARITTALQRYVRLGKRFTQTAPNTFALKPSA